MVFTQYRDTLEMIHQKLEKEGIKSVKFYGQASRDGEKGLTQKEQKEIIKAFKMGEYDNMGNGGFYAAVACFLRKRKDRIAYCRALGR